MRLDKTQVQRGQHFQRKIVNCGDNLLPLHRISPQVEVIAQNYGFFCQFRSKLVISYTTAFKRKEKYDAVVVDCHHSLCLCGDNENESP